MQTLPAVCIRTTENRQRTKNKEFIMLDYTRAAFNKIADDMKKLLYLIEVSSQVAYIVYLIYALVTGAGNLIANILLSVISVGYFILFLFVTTGEVDKAKKQIKKTAKTIVKRSKLIIKAYSLGIIVYGFFATAKKITPVSLLLTVFMLAGWLIQSLFEVVFAIVGSRFKFVMEGVEADIEEIVKPVKTVGNFFKKISGKEVEPEKAPTKHRLWLNKQVAQKRQEKKDEKLRKKLEKKQQREDARNTKYYQKQKPMARKTEERIEVFEDTPQIENTKDEK